MFHVADQFMSEPFNKAHDGLAVV